MKKFFRLVLFTVGTAVAAGFFILYQALLAPNNFPEGKDKVLFVSKGMNFENVTAELEKKKIINRFYFDLAVSIIGGESKLIIGKYKIPSGLSNHELLNVLRSGNAIVPILVTIPEGASIKTQARIFKNAVGTDSAVYVNLAFNKDFIRTYVHGVSSLEGYLFPSTYECMWQMDEETILKKEIETFKKNVNDSVKFYVKKNGFTVHEVLTLASIIQGETKIDSERPLIAGVYLNRLKQNMPLQADPTVQYALSDGPRRLHYRDYKIVSPYNTYIHYGLPPGPVNNPGINSILSVLFPQKTKDIFFVANGSGGHTFTTNYTDHLKAVKKLQRVLQERDEQKELLRQQNESKRDSSSFSGG